MATPLPPGQTVPPINFAARFGFNSILGAFLFTLLYMPLTMYFLWQTYRRFCYVHLFIATFCGARVGAFGLRAVLIIVDSAAENRDLLLVDLVFFGAGFSSLLYAIFSLQHDRDYLAGIHYETRLMKTFGNKHVFHGILLVAIAISIGGTILAFYASNPDYIKAGNKLREAGTWVVFILSVVYTIKVIFFIELAGRQETIHHKTISSLSKYGSRTIKLGNKHTSILLASIATLLMIRQIYSIAVVRISGQSEITFYPLSATPEFLSVCLLAIPGLIVSQKEFKEKVDDMDLPTLRLLGPGFNGPGVDSATVRGLGHGYNGGSVDLTKRGMNGDENRLLPIGLIPGDEYRNSMMSKRYGSSYSSLIVEPLDWENIQKPGLYKMSSDGSDGV